MESQVVQVMQSDNPACPSCNLSWKGEDIVKCLSKREFFRHKTEQEVRQIAEELYGYGKGKDFFFKNMVVIIRNDRASKVKCMGCGKIFDID